MPADHTNDVQPNQGDDSRKMRVKRMRGDYNRHHGGGRHRGRGRHHRGRHRYGKRDTHSGEATSTMVNRHDVSPKDSNDVTVSEGHIRVKRRGSTKRRPHYEDRTVLDEFSKDPITNDVQANQDVSSGKMRVKRMRGDYNRHHGGGRHHGRGRHHRGRHRYGKRDTHDGDVASRPTNNRNNDSDGVIEGHIRVKRKGTRRQSRRQKFEIGTVEEKTNNENSLNGYDDHVPVIRDYGYIPGELNANVRPPQHVRIKRKGNRGYHLRHHEKRSFHEKRDEHKEYVHIEFSLVSVYF